MSALKFVAIAAGVGVVVYFVTKKGESGSGFGKAVGQVAEGGKAIVDMFTRPAPLPDNSPAAAHTSGPLDSASGNIAAMGDGLGIDKSKGLGPQPVDYMSYRQRATTGLIKGSMFGARGAVR